MHLSRVVFVLIQLGDRDFTSGSTTDRMMNCHDESAMSIFRGNKMSRANTDTKDPSTYWKRKAISYGLNTHSVCAYCKMLLRIIECAILLFFCWGHVRCCTLPVRAGQASCCGQSCHLSGMLLCAKGESR